MKILITLFLCLLLGPASTTWAVNITGKLTQGGYITGHIPNAKTITVNGQKATIVQDRFFFGLHREFPPEATVKITKTDKRAQEQAFIITPQSYKTQHIQGVSQKTVTPDPAQVKRSRQEAQKIRAARQGQLNAAHLNFQWPVTGPITGVYGSRRTYNGQERSWHKGLDIAPPHGTPIRPIEQGKVALALDTFFNGNLIIIDHGLGLHSIYAHLDEMRVTAGEQISKNTIIGTVGNTGRSTGPHLHLGIYWHQTALDPILFLPGGKK